MSIKVDAQIEDERSDVASDNKVNHRYIAKSTSTNSRNIRSIFIELLNPKEDRSTKEIGTIILLGIMLLLFIISVTGFFVMWFTKYYDNSMLSNLILAENSETAKSWIDPSTEFDTLLKVHIFNYTNIDDYLRGKADKIHVVDFGPLTYKEHTKKVDVSFNKNYTVTFRDNKSYIFLPEKSTFNESDKFYVPNVPFLSAAVKIEGYSYLARFGAVALIKSTLPQPFKTLTAHEFLWGYRDPIMEFSGDPIFGLLKNRNGTSPDSLQLNTGEDDLEKFSKITQFNGMPAMDFWSDDECNRVDGSDPSMFSPHLLENRENLQVFLQVLCRKVPLEFVEEVVILDNIDALRYITPINVFSHPENNSENHCYCRNTRQCMPSGVINATKCYNDAPIYPSFPHFYSGDPNIYKDFVGINPNAELHQTFADVHPRFAFPINGASRIQINIAVHKNQVVGGKLDRMKEGTILPLLWIEITPGDFTKEIKDKLFISTFGLNAIQNALKYGTIFICILSFSLIVFAFYYLNRKWVARQNKTTINAFQIVQLTNTSTAKI